MNPQDAVAYYNGGFVELYIQVKFLENMCQGEVAL